MKVLRIGVCALVFFGVFSHGAVEDWARVVLEIGAALLFLAWAVRGYLTEEHQLVVSPLLLPLVALLLIALGQWVFHRTASPYGTRIELQLLLADILLLFLAAQAFRTLEDWRSFVWFVMSFGFFVSLFGILQHLTFNGKLYWVRELRFGGIPFGPYVNRNHFAGLVELLIPPGFAILILRAEQRDQLPLVALFTLFPIGALFLAASRGGIISFLAEIGLLAILIIFRRRAGRELVAAGL